MRMLAGDFNVYYYCKTLDPKGLASNVRAACYGNDHSGGLVPEVGDVINDFHGLMDLPIRVRVDQVTPIGQGCTAFEVQVTPDPADQRGGTWDPELIDETVAQAMTQYPN